MERATQETAAPNAHSKAGAQGEADTGRWRIDHGHGAAAKGAATAGPGGGAVQQEAAQYRTLQPPSILVCHANNKVVGRIMPFSASNA